MRRHFGSFAATAAVLTPVLFLLGCLNEDFREAIHEAGQEVKTNFKEIDFR